MDIQITHTKRWHACCWALSVLAMGLSLYLAGLVYVYSPAEANIYVDTARTSATVLAEPAVLKESDNKWLSGRFTPAGQVEGEKSQRKFEAQTNMDELLIRFSEPLLNKEIDLWSIEALAAKFEIQELHFESERLVRQALSLDYQLQSLLRIRSKLSSQNF